MASRRDIKIAVRDDILTAVSGSVPSERVVFTNSGSRDLAYPHIVFSLFDVPRNDVHGTQPAPYKHLTDSNGNKTHAVYAAHYRGFVDISIEGDSQDTDALYEDVRQQFLPYTMWKSENDLHPDASDIIIDDSSTSQNTDTDPTVFDSIVSLEIDYALDVTRDGTPIEQINHQYDVDDDGSIDRSHTTNI